MSDYLTRATAALDAFIAARAGLAAALAALAADAGVPAAAGRRVHEALERLDAGATALRRSFTHLATTALDIVDLQTRLEGESASIAAGLRALGEAIEQTPALGEPLMPAATALEEAAAALASATFPGVVDGLAAVNRSLWDFRGPVWVAYERVLATVVGQGSLTPLQVGRIEQTARNIRARFDAVNDLLNALAASPFHDRVAIERMFAEARTNLTRALADARSRAGDAYKPFHGVLRRAEGVAARVLKGLGRCRVPAFPTPEALDADGLRVDRGFYASLGGAQRFALLNILAGLRSIAPLDAGVPSLLHPRYVRSVFAAFPDRIYLAAEPALLAALDALQATGRFAPAPAALHRFRDGSIKQREYRKGNVQCSYERRADVVRVDVDIDLYRGPVSHLFGEVLINHLTGSTTCQYDVRRVLDARGVPPCDGFDIVVPAV